MRISSILLSITLIILWTLRPMPTRKILKDFGGKSGRPSAMVIESTICMVILPNSFFENPDYMNRIHEIFIAIGKLYVGSTLPAAEDDSACDSDVDSSVE
ncbi:hypothetical protein BgiMline_013574 [Biomphalaria glabrata]